MRTIFFIIFPKVNTGQGKNGYFETKMVTIPLKYTLPGKVIRFISLKFSHSRRYIKKEEEIIYIIIVQMLMQTFI